MDVGAEWRAVGERVREARVAYSLSQADLADRVGIERTALVKIESGVRRVSAMELFRFVDALAVPASYFVAPPRAAVVSRRSTLADDPGQADRARWRLDVALDAHARDVEQLTGHDLLPVAHQVRPRAPVDSVHPARELGRDARDVLGLGDEPVGALADACEQFGLYLLVLDEDADGASVLLDGEEGRGAAVVGGRRDPGRRRWTAAHELGHHVMGDEYQSDAGVHSARDEREQLIDAFVGEFLLPEAGLRRAWARRKGDDPRVALVEVAASYRASWSAVVNAAERAGLVDDGLAHTLRSDRPVRGDFIAVTGVEPVPDLIPGATGAQWRRAVMAGYQRGLYTAARAVELVHGLFDEDELPASSDRPA